MNFYTFLAALCAIVTGTSSKNVGGYFFGAAYSPKVSEINPRQLTHLYYAFLGVEDDARLTIQHGDAPGIVNMVKSLPTLKKANPNLKLLFSAVNQKNSLSTVSASQSLRKAFAQNAVKFIQQYAYDGLDLDWEFPKPNDKENFILLLKELKAAFKPHNYLLTAAVQAIPVSATSGYNVKEMVKYLDMINIMTYDFYGPWSQHTGENSPLYPSSKDSAFEKQYLNFAASGGLWQQAGAPKEKLNLGIPFYGNAFTLANPSDHGVHAAIKGPGAPETATYYKIRKNYSQWTEVWDDETKNPYRYHGNQWIGFDDRRAVIEKVKYVIDQGYPGVFVWQLGGDDIQGEFGAKWELLTAISDNIGKGNSNEVS